MGKILGLIDETLAGALLAAYGAWAYFVLGATTGLWGIAIGIYFMRDALEKVFK